MECTWPSERLCVNSSTGRKPVRVKTSTCSHSRFLFIEKKRSYHGLLWALRFRKNFSASVFPHLFLAGYLSAMSWSVSVSTFTLYKVVKVYAGTRWYATYFKTLIKVCDMCSLHATSYPLFWSAKVHFGRTDIPSQDQPKCNKKHKIHISESFLPKDGRLVILSTV